MRLSDIQQKHIKQILLKHFGSASKILLFGSRINDLARGGDIDLYIEPELADVDQIVEAKLNALVEIEMVLGEQRIDIVVNRNTGYELPIYHVARNTGVPL